MILPYPTIGTLSSSILTTQPFLQHFVQPSYDCTLEIGNNYGFFSYNSVAVLSKRYVKYKFLGTESLKQGN